MKNVCNELSRRGAWRNIIGPGAISIRCTTRAHLVHRLLQAVALVSNGASKSCTVVMVKRRVC